MAEPTLRDYIHLIEATVPWGISKTDLFEATFQAHLAKVSDLPNRLKRFIDIKLPNPIGQNALVGKHDRPFTAALVGFWHCHLAPDLILIYRLQNHCVQLVMLCQHAEIEGKRQKAVVKRLGTLAA